MLHCISSTLHIIRVIAIFSNSNRHSIHSRFLVFISVLCSYLSRGCNSSALLDCTLFVVRMRRTALRAEIRCFLHIAEPSVLWRCVSCELGTFNHLPSLETNLMHLNQAHLTFFKRHFNSCWSEVVVIGMVFAQRVVPHTLKTSTNNRHMTCFVQDMLVCSTT